MPKVPRSVFLSLFFLSSVLPAFCLQSAIAQGYPNKPIRLIVPYAPGGSVDAMARVFGQKYSEAWGQPVLVENRAGAGGNIGAEVVAKSAPDGYTWLLNSVGQAIAPGLYRKLNYDAVRELTPVTEMVSTSLILACSPQLPVASVKELIARAKAQPGKLNFGSTGVGSAPHLVGEMLRSAAKIDIVHVPYKGDSQLYPALITNEVQLAIIPPQTGLAQVKSGKLRALAVTGASRASSLPEIPTMMEAGVPDFEFNGWVGLFAAGGTPADIVNRIAGEAARMLTLPDVTKYYAGWGVDPVGSRPEAFAVRYRSEIEKYTRVIREAKIPLVD
jgi:tripartite-type tricarboxylate transporter receptor subunit TctC